MKLHNYDIGARLHTATINIELLFWNISMKMFFFENNILWKICFSVFPIQYINNKKRGKKIKIRGTRYKYNTTIYQKPKYNKVYLHKGRVSYMHIIMLWILRLQWILN